jgi:hypothetical protein
MTIYSYKLYPLSHLYCYEVYKFLENSNKAIVPQILINDITNKYDDELTFPLYYQFKETNIVFTYYESVIDIDAIYLPKYMFEELKIEEGEIKEFNLLKDSLPKGSKCVLQPHTSNFFEIQDYRNYLEKVFSENYSSLSENTTIQIPFFDNFIKLNVIKLEPKSISSIIDTDLTVNFEKALDYVEPPPLKKKGIGLSFKLNNNLVKKFLDNENENKK